MGVDELRQIVGEHRKEPRSFVHSDDADIFRLREDLAAAGADGQATA